MAVEILRNLQAFNNRYAVFIPEYTNLHHISQLSFELGAIDPVLTKNAEGKVYLTAKEFKSLAFLIEKAKSLGYSPTYGNSQVFHIDHWLFDCVSYHHI